MPPLDLFLTFDRSLAPFWGGLAAGIWADGHVGEASTETKMGTDNLHFFVIHGDASIDECHGLRFLVLWRWWCLVASFAKNARIFPFFGSATKGHFGVSAVERVVESR